LKWANDESDHPQRLVKFVRFLLPCWCC
jgi:hypothetical protein